MKYEGNKFVKYFTCWNQLLVMKFGQLSNRDNLRDLTSTISAHSNKAYHLSFGKNGTRSNLAKVNERRKPCIFEEFAYHMIDIARKKRIDKDFEIYGKGVAFDSITIDLCRIQIYSAITAYYMVAIVEHDFKLHRSTYEVLRILIASLLDKTPIKEFFTKELEYVADDGQLTLNLI